ncbi:cystinosin-like [Symsagittifera roscoffensis]|uniref:cystinosin-like n=1 Tax=Symsagittifera roscoffensis TaxID=84072 RepID=UPI00307C46CF
MVGSFWFCSVLLLFVTTFSNSSGISFHASPDSQYIEVDKNGSFEVWFKDNNITDPIEINIIVSTNNQDVIQDYNRTTYVIEKEKTSMYFYSDQPGNADISFNFTDVNNYELNSGIMDVYIHIHVIRSHPLDVFNDVIGWIYFFAWSISFYPQIFSNVMRRSVVGLNFDFLAYNLLGFSVYSVFNVGLYWVPYIQDEYRDENPGQLIPVKLNDVVFSLHATLITMVTISTCFFFKRDNQKVSWVCRVFVIVSLLLIVLLAIFTMTGDFKRCSWLNFINWISYIKLAVSFIKYVPQAWMNYERKSTIGWSIGNVLLDFTGGSLSILQSLLLSYNSNDWPSLIADPVKFGLGFLSIIFDILFMIQHYILYRHAKDENSDIWPKSYRVFENSTAESEPSWNPASDLGATTT